MAHLLYDFNYLFSCEKDHIRIDISSTIQANVSRDTSLSPLDIYELTICEEICDDDFLAIKWAVAHDLRYHQCTVDVTGFGIIKSSRAASCAIRSNSLRCLKYVCDSGYNCRVQDAQLAAEYGSLDCLEYLFDDTYAYGDAYGDDIYGLCNRAVAGGHCNCLEYLHKMGCPLSSMATNCAATAGSLECLKYLRENGCPILTPSYNAAAAEGHLDCLEYLYENGDEWNNSICIYALINGRTECLKYAFERRTDPNLAYNQMSTTQRLLQLHPVLEEVSEQIDYAVEAFNVFGNIADSLFENPPEEVFGIPIGSMRDGFGKLEDICNLAIKYGQLDCLMYLREQGCKMEETSCDIAARYGQLKILQYLREEGFEWSADTCKAAVARGQLECLKYLHEEGCPWNSSALYLARQTKRTKCIRYMLENDENRNLYMDGNRIECSWHKGLIAFFICMFISYLVF